MLSRHAPYFHIMNQSTIYRSQIAVAFGIPSHVTMFTYYTQYCEVTTNSTLFYYYNYDYYYSTVVWRRCVVVMALDVRPWASFSHALASANKQYNLALVT